MNSYSFIFHHWSVKYFCWVFVFVLQIWENRRDSWRMSLTWNWSPSVNCAPATAAPGMDVEETRMISSSTNISSTNIVSAWHINLHLISYLDLCHHPIVTNHSRNSSPSYLNSLFHLFTIIPCFPGRSTLSIWPLLLVARLFHLSLFHSHVWYQHVWCLW